jgi:hypothetical protein
MLSGKVIQENMLRYCNSMKGDEPGRYKYSVDCPETMWGSAFTALTMGLIGEVEKLPQAEREGWIKHLQSYQDEETGYFVDPLFKEDDRENLNRGHSQELINAHSSTFVMGALVVLGGKPLYPISWTHQYRDPAKMVKWIEALPWAVTPWTTGNWTYDMGCAVGMDYLVTGDEANLEAMETYFDWMDKNQQDNGWWDLAGGSLLSHQLYGGYHTLMVYWMFDRPVPRFEPIIDTTLSLQNATGLFGNDGLGGCCEDMDAIDTLVVMSQASGYKDKEIKEALSKALMPIVKKQNADGGFYDNLTWGRSEFGWDLCSAQLGESEMNSTLFQSFSVSLIGEFIEDERIMDTVWNHHQTYCHFVRKKAIIK